ncbi:vanillate O-demethylase monooxygenase subunit [Sphingobium xenophagum]|uniref:Vanillate O-demethylase monooxygenase subunit n=1 Tax=Sphingobium xenophagum TaxID=121428 RepID=A0ABU1X6I2_SPHXE|nr:aromatic ring-hydroxylating dioxygenase subunit alpha [Sphingobium xenophagum]MDR7157180.1 vanillate O-demethylase monooxygenase subunit [Sphingobium xenophagum]
MQIETTNQDSSKEKPATWAAPRPSAERNYPMNCWWVGAFSSEVGRELLGRWLLDTPVLFYRSEEGDVVALEDRCPHRAAPLSLGCLQGDEVQCGYHGFRFDRSGANTWVPSARTAVRSARIRAFPVIEKPPYVWVYLGDESVIDDVPPPPVLEWAEDDSFGMIKGRMEIKANYMLLKENVLDLTHFGYVHASTFKITDWVDLPEFTANDTTATYRQFFKESPLSPAYAVPLGLPPGIPYDRDNYGSFESPALQRGQVDFLDPKTNAVTGRFRVAHATTPINQNTMQYFWVLGRDHGRSPEELDAFSKFIQTGFEEDEAMIVAIQAAEDRKTSPVAPREVSVKMDTAGIQARRIVQKWMDRETG